MSKTLLAATLLTTALALTAGCAGAEPQDREAQRAVDTELLDRMTDALWPCVTTMPEFGEEFIADMAATGLGREMGENILGNKNNLRAALLTLMQEDPSTVEQFQEMIPLLKETCPATAE